MSKLLESSVTRILSKIKEFNCGIITAYRGDKTEAENRENNAKLLAFLRSKGYSVTAVKGSYIENFSNDKEKKKVSENSFFVSSEGELDKLRYDLYRVGRLYDQDSVLIIPKGGEDAYLLGTSKRGNSYPRFNTEAKVGKKSLDQSSIPEFFTQIKNKILKFESVEVEEVDIEYQIESIEEWSDENAANWLGRWGVKLAANEVQKELDQLQD